MLIPFPKLSGFLIPSTGYLFNRRQISKVKNLIAFSSKTSIAQVNLHPRVVGTTTDLEVTASTESAGRYFCKANSPGFPELRAEATVSLKGPPKIISPNEQFPNTITVGGLLASSPLAADNPRRSMSGGGDSDAFEIECVAISIPKAEHVSWAFNGKLIDFDADEGFTLRESYRPDGVKSTLTIEENHVDYFGKYSCIVINSYGSDTLEIFFTEPSEECGMLVGKLLRFCRHSSQNHYSCPTNIVRQAKN